jgi:[acyl-carrier-protein] S-malonyltransferase
VTHTAYIFPGQGSQSVGMGQALFRAYGVAQLTFEEADDILSFRLSELCFAGPVETLTDTRNAQPAILVTSIAALRVLQEERPELPWPCCVAGHSLGEYTALVASGALAFADAIRLTRVRGELMALAGSTSPGSMAAILRLDDEQVAALCSQAAVTTGEVVQVANYNAPGQVVISGANAGVAAAMELATAAGGRPRPLAVSIASHSALMAPAAREFAEYVDGTSFASPECPVISNLNAHPLLTPRHIRKELVAQLTSPVRWTDSVKYMAASGASRFVELGPGSVLTGLVKRIQPDAATANVAEPADIASV